MGAKFISQQLDVEERCRRVLICNLGARLRSIRDQINNEQTRMQETLATTYKLSFGQNYS